MDILFIDVLAALYLYVFGVAPTMIHYNTKHLYIHTPSVLPSSFLILLLYIFYDSYNFDVANLFIVQHTVLTNIKRRSLIE